MEGQHGQEWPWNDSHLVKMIWIHQLSDTEAFAADDFVATIEVLFDFGKTGDPLPEFEGLPIPLRQRLLISPIDMYPVKKLW